MREEKGMKEKEGGVIEERADEEGDDEEEVDEEGAQDVEWRVGAERGNWGSEETRDGNAPNFANYHSGLSSYVDRRPFVDVI